MREVSITTRTLAKLAFEAEPTPWGLLLCADCIAPIQIKAVADDRKAVPTEYYEVKKTDFSWSEKDGQFENFSELFAEPSEYKFSGHYNVRILLIRCRKCQPCVTARSRMWSIRARHECEQSARTWLTTLTVEPQYRLQLRINSRRSSGDETFPSLAAAFGKWFTLYKKRIRKETGITLRTLCAFEKHADGFPHLHALLHEQSDPVRKEVLNRQWPWGFSHHKLVDPDASSYVTKYISKEMHNRVRASMQYGSHVNTAYSPQAITAQLDKHNKLGLAEKIKPPYHEHVKDIEQFKNRDCTYVKISPEIED